MLERINIVMVKPSHSGNVGAAARAMKNMGLSKLTVVTEEPFPDQVALTRAAGADDILKNTSVTNTLEEAVAQSHVIYATSARARNLPWPMCTPKEAVQRILKTPPVQQIAIVFGRERTGLTNEELSLAHYHIQIPTVSDFSSLNLSQAIQVMAYELFVGCSQFEVPLDCHDKEPLATGLQVEGFFEQLQLTLEQLAILDPKQPKMLMHRLRRLFARTQLEEKEINILRGLLTAVNRLEREAVD